jgi:hypothetical protein
VRIRRKYTVVLALAAAGALAVAGIALAATSSDFEFRAIPGKAPKKKYQSGALKTKLVTNYTNPGNGNPDGAVERTQIYLDKNFKVNPKAAKKCSETNLSGQTMAGAMAACSKALVGKGKAQAINPANGQTIYACVLLFNGTPQGGKPTLQVFTRVDVTGAQIDCSNPSTNTGGHLVVLLKGVYKNASGKYSKVLDVNHITDAAAFPLTLYKTKVKKGNYASARCKAKNHKWHMKVVWTYNKVGDQGGSKAKIHKTQKCKVKH